MNLTSLIAVVLSLMSFGSAWQIQNWRMDSHEKTRITEQAATQRELHVLQQKRSLDVNNAQNARVSREVGLRTDSTNLRAVSGGLRVERAKALGSLGLTTPNCTKPATASGQLLRYYEDSSRETEDALIELATAADRHVSDIKTLTETWPK